MNQEVKILEGSGSGGGVKRQLTEKKFMSENKHRDAWDKCSGLVHWEDPEGSGGEGGGRGDWDGEYM